MVTEELQKKQDHLEAYLKQLGSVVLAVNLLVYGRLFRAWKLRSKHAL